MNISEIDFGAELAAMNEKFKANSESITLPERPVRRYERARRPR